jgi:PAS domain S-box-containing protein
MRLVRDDASRVSCLHRTVSFATLAMQCDTAIPNQACSQQPAAFQPLSLQVIVNLVTVGLLLSLGCSLLTYYGNTARWHEFAREPLTLSQRLDEFVLEEAIRATTVMVLVTLVLVLLAAQLVRGHVIRPLNLLIETVTRRAHGDTTAYAPENWRNELGRLACTMNEMFERLEARESERNKLALVADKTDNGVLIADAQGRIEWVNEALTTITGRTSAAASGMTILEFLQGPASDPDTLKTMQDCLLQGAPCQAELRICDLSERKIWISVELRPICDQRGNLRNTIGILRDISQRKENEARLDDMIRDVVNARAVLQEQTTALQDRNAELIDVRERAELAIRTKSEFLANMSHEIRTPMTAILGYSEILLGGIQDPLLVQSAQTIKRNGEYLLDLLNDILDFSKIEAGCMNAELIPCSPVQLLDDVILLMKIRAAAKGLELKARYVGLLPEQILCDPTRLRQILLNLVGNALKFTEHGSVVVTVRATQGDAPQLQFEVNDTGIGMSHEQMSRLFRPFTQSDSSTTRKYGGTGLGLSICKRLAELLNGSISVCSAPGKGSSFTLTLHVNLPPGSVWRNPRQEAAPEVTLARQQAWHAPAKTAAAHEDQLAYRILLAEDGPDNQRLIMLILQKAGAEVVLADNGWVALNLYRDMLARGERIDCVLMDIQMPVMDGYQATQELRREGYAGPILALTANAMSDDRQRCLDAGCDDFTTKPIVRAELLELIQRYCGIHARVPGKEAETQPQNQLG